MSDPAPGQPPRIVFVDDEARVLSGLRRQLHARRDEWDLRFVEGGPQCLAALEQTPADVVVSDMRMPGMDGAQLLSRVAAGWPRTARLVLSGHADPDRMLVARSCAHRYLHKPCPPELLEAEVRRALRLRAALDTCGWTVVEKLWGSAPDLDAAEAAAAPLPRAGEVSAETAVALLAERPALRAALGELLGLEADAAPEALLERIGVRHVAGPLLALHLHDRFLAAGRARALRLAERIRRVAAGGSPAPEAVVQAAAAALLVPVWDSLPTGSAPEPAVSAELLQFLLSGWGLPDAVVATVACLRRPESCPAPLSGPLSLLCGAELLAAWEGAPPEEAPDAARQAEISGWLAARGQLPRSPQAPQGAGPLPAR